MSIDVPVNFEPADTPGGGGTANIVAIPPLVYSDSTGILYVSDATSTSMGIVNTGTQAFGGTKTFDHLKCAFSASQPTDVVNLATVQNYLSGTSWLEPVITIWNNPLVYPTATVGARYIAGVNTLAWLKPRIYEYNGSVWIDVLNADPQNGDAVYATADNASYIFVSSANVWQPFGISLDHTNLKNIGTLTHVQLEAKIPQTGYATTSDVSFNSISGLAYTALATAGQYRIGKSVSTGYIYGTQDTLQISNNGYYTSGGGWMSIAPTAGTAVVSLAGNGVGVLLSPSVGTDPASRITLNSTAATFTMPISAYNTFTLSDS